MSQSERAAAPQADAPAEQPAVNHPEVQIGPVGPGIKVAIWRNMIDTPDGPRYVRQLTLSARRYQDKRTGEWKDAAGYRLSDIPYVLHVLQRAQSYCFTHPLPVPAADLEGDNGEAPY
jgi:hypothetical protein